VPSSKSTAGKEKNQLEVVNGSRFKYSTYHQMGVSKNSETPQNGWFIIGIPTKRDDLEVPLFLETSI